MALLFAGCGPGGAIPDLSQAPVSIDLPLAPLTLSLASGQGAVNVVGQADFTAATSAVTRSGFNQPAGTTTAASGVFYVADSQNHRVVGFNSIPAGNGALADFVLGQASFTARVSGASATALNAPADVFYNDGKLFIADSGNHRVLIHNTAPVAGGAAADVVVGQSTMTASAAACTATGMNQSQSVFAGGGKLLVSDTYHRVLVYNSVPAASGAAADVVLGRPNFTTCAGSGSVAGLSSPVGLWTDGTRVAVADAGNNRVLIWNTFPTSNNQPADIVLGQPNLASNAANNGGLSSKSMYLPTDVISNGTQFFVVDNLNNRILVWSSFPTSNFAPADLVLGQAGFSTDALATTANGLQYPSNLHLADRKLIVSDMFNHRVVVFDGSR